jgi:hypothetical protein
MSCAQRRGVQADRGHLAQITPGDPCWRDAAVPGRDQVPGLRARGGPPLGPGLRPGEDRAVCIRPAIAAAGSETADAFHARRDEHVALTGPNGVKRHPGGLQRR